MTPEGAQRMLHVEGLSKQFHVKRRGKRKAAIVKAVTDVSFTVRAGSTLGIVGESGCGKSTLARLLAGLESPTSGSASVDGVDLFGQERKSRLERATRLQMVFQDPYTSLDPRMRIIDVVSEPWEVHRGILERSARRGRAEELMRLVGLDPAMLTAPGRSLSGGQRQRVGLARALALDPKILVLDEPVSALDVSVQAQVVELLREIQARTAMTMIFIAHDLAVVRSLASHVAVMYLGRIVETGTTMDVFANPRHPYTQALLASAPSFRRTEAGTTKVIIHGEAPSPRNIPTGCSFRTRCPIARDECAVDVPRLEMREDIAHPVACHFPPAEALFSTHIEHRNERQSQ